MCAYYLLFGDYDDPNNVYFSTMFGDADWSMQIDVRQVMTHLPSGI